MTGTEFLAELNEQGMSENFGERSRVIVNIESETEQWNILLARLDYTKGRWLIWDDDRNMWAPQPESEIRDILRSLDIADIEQVRQDFKDRDSHTYRRGKDPRFNGREQPDADELPPAPDQPTLL